VLVPDVLGGLLLWWLAVSEWLCWWPKGEEGWLCWCPAVFGGQVLKRERAKRIRVAAEEAIKNCTPSWLPG